MDIIKVRKKFKPKAVINKIVLTKMAVFDYENIVINKPLDKKVFIKRLSQTIDKLKNNITKNYVSYIDLETGKELAIFIKKGQKIGNMQYYIVYGIA